MGNVWKAMKRHEAEAAETRGPEQQRAEGRTEAAATPTQQGVEQTSDAGAEADQLHGRNGFAPPLCVYHDRGGRLAEEYRALRTNLLARSRDQQFCYVVTSAIGGEGKTLTSLNLALVMAERRDYRTVVVDCDFRRPQVARLLRMDSQPGMAEVLRSEASLADVLRPTVYSNLSVIPAGRVRADELGELVTRAELSEAISSLRRDYDYVLLDTPPVNSVSETGMIGRIVGEALVVVRMNKTRRESVEKALGLLHAADVEVAGIILTHQRYYIPDYLYRYS